MNLNVSLKGANPLTHAMFVYVARTAFEQNFDGAGWAIIGTIQRANGATGACSMR